MKRVLASALLLALLLTLTACAALKKENTDPSEGPEQTEQQEQHLTADVPETKTWQRSHGAVWGSDPTPVSASFERISGAADKGMTVGQELLLLDFMDCYYQSISALEIIDPSDLFTTVDETVYHKTIWHGLCIIRRLSPIDLTMTSYSYSLRCTSLEPSPETEGDVDVVLKESNVVYFAGLDGIPSEQFGIKHTFTLRSVGGDRWRIVSHASDDNAYYSADYDRTTRQDNHFPAITDYIEARRDLPREGLMVDASADHPYDRQAARTYMLAYVGRRNPGFMAYDDYGGNCMNFGSQVLLAGGIPMDTSGGYETGWYWFSQHSTTLPWVNVGWFLDYAAAEREHGLAAVVNAPYFSGETGDIITMGVDEPANHTTVILDVIRDENGLPIDYLLCSNTADLRNFPASAYYYTNRQLTKIIGWNE